jgi:hypothetical protein
MKCTDAGEQPFRAIIADAIGALSRSRRSTTNIYLDTRVRERGELIGPEFQNIKTRQPCIVVFVDDHPRANFGHCCRYRLYDAKSQRFLLETPAAFPPYVDDVPETFIAIHKPVQPVTGSEEIQFYAKRTKRELRPRQAR